MFWLSAAMLMTLTQDNPFRDVQWLTVPSASSPLEGSKWIWVQKPGESRPSVAGARAGTITFTRIWDIEGTPEVAKATMTADNSAILRINGREVGRATAWNRLYEFNLKGILKPGPNQIEVEATNDPGNNILNPAGFIFKGTASGSGKLVALVSGTSWISRDGRVVEIGEYGISPWRSSKADVPCPVFVHSVRLPKPLKAAKAYVVGLGHYDLLVNGKRQGNDFLNQPWSQYDKTLYWQEFDVTKDLRSGLNQLEFQMGNSWYRVAQPPQGRYAKGDAMPDFSGDAPYLLGAVFELEYADGSRERVTTDKSWKWTHGPYLLSHVFAGEDYDARPQGRYMQPVKIAAVPKAQLLKSNLPPFRALQTFRATQILNPQPGEWSYVFPQNAMAILRFRVRGKSGQTVKFRPSEVMNAKGQVEQLNLWGGDASASYTLAGGKSESHEWRFWYHGFQFVKVTGAVPAGKPNPDDLPVLEDLQMVHVRTDNAQTGSFRSSSDLYNRIHNLVDWAMRSNMAFVMTDCPHREKLGWQEQVHLLARTFMYRYDCDEWFHKIARDLRDAQVPDGRFPTVAPDYLVRPIDDQYKFTVEWGASGVLMPWQAYEWYGDTRFLSENYDSMRKYVDWLEKDAQDGIARKGLGDWYDYGHGQSPGPSRYTPTDLTSTCIYAMCVQAMADSAQVLGKAADVRRYRALHEGIRQGFLRKFYNAGTKTLVNSGSVQSGHAMALCADLIPQADRAAVLDGIVRELQSRGYQQTAGDVGHLFFIRALAEAGRSDVLHKVYSRTGVGSYGGILAKGLTTMPETWDAITVGSNSLNHCMLGHVMEWFYGWVLGIRQAPGSVGWKEILIAPEWGSLSDAAGQIRVPTGTLSVSWKAEASKWTIDAAIPRGSVGWVPTRGREVKMDGRAAQIDAKRKMVRVPPGRHRIELD